MANKRRKKSWWKTIKFKYRLTVVNENTLEEVLSLSVSKLNGLSVLLSFIGVLILLTALLMIYTPLRNYLPGYMSNELRAQIVENSLLTDSLERAVERQNRYIQNVQDVLAGKMTTDSVLKVDSLTEMKVDELMTATVREREFADQYEKDERYNLTNYAQQHVNADGMVFFRPVRGMISKRFDKQEAHYGVDIAANPNESVLATLDGAVIWTTFTPQMGYVVAVQHKKDWVSIYKNCETLLKMEGETVKAGEVIALVGGKEKSGPHLHFELWHKGQAQNPETYIVF